MASLEPKKETEMSDQSIDDGFYVDMPSHKEEWDRIQKLTPDATINAATTIVFYPDIVGPNASRLRTHTKSEE
jgi:hypothetical protein